MKRLITFCTLSLIVFFFVGVINLDEEFGQHCFFIKMPPSTQILFGIKSGDVVDETNGEYYYTEFLPRYRNYQALEWIGELIAAGLVQLLLATVFIKFKFSKRIRFILLDLFLFAFSTLIIIFCLLALDFMHWRYWESLLALLVIDFILFRLLRPVKKY